MSENSGSILLIVGRIEGKIDSIVDRLDAQNGRIGKHDDHLNKHDDNIAELKVRDAYVAGAGAASGAFLGWLLHKLLGL